MDPVFVGRQLRTDRRYPSWIAFWLMGSILTTAAMAQEPEAKKLKIFVLVGQSNMVGHANYITIPHLTADPRPEVRELARMVMADGEMVTKAEVDDQIATKIARDQRMNELRANPIDDATALAAARQEIETLSRSYESKSLAIQSKFAVSDRVHITSVADNNRRSGPLTIGYGANAEKIGPELGFGMSLIKRIDAPILLIKVAWGGKSLHYNFRPPSVGPYELSEQEAAGENAATIREQAGLNYRLLIEQVDHVLANVADHHPAYDPAVGYELAGLVWFQGFNDQFSDPFRDNYKANMIAFIKDIRRQWSVPELPVVIGVLGTGITAEEVAKNAVSLGQRAAAAEPEFQGNVLAVESYELFDLEALEVFNKGWQEHFAEWSAVGSDRPYHYLGSGKFFIRLGDAFAQAMIELQQRRQQGTRVK